MLHGVARALNIVPARPRPAPPQDEGLEANGFYLEADDLVRDDRNDTWTAKGGVEARYQGRTLRADEMRYDARTGTGTAKGHVQILNPDGTSEFADETTLDEQMRAGVALGFSARLQANLKFAAAAAIRRSETVNELKRAIFTPCDICAEDGSPKTPTWSIQAETVTQDHARKLVYYRNAVILVKGVPVFYTPVFWHADPQAVSTSGLLTPMLRTKSTRGVSYEQAYLWVISPSEDLTVSPQINSKVNPFLNLELRKRFYSGSVDVRVGYTYERDFDSDGNRFGDQTSRAYVLGKGAFDIDGKWSWGFSAERTSDDLLFRKYDIVGVYEDRGPYTADDGRLLSQLYATRQDERSYLSIAALDFQGLRPLDNDAAFPVAAPLIEGRYEAPVPILGGRLRVDASGVVLTRQESPLDPVLPGTDSRRATAQADWRRTFILPSGIRLDPFISGRGDLYNVSDLSASDRDNHTIGRGIATAGVDFSWPFVRRQGNATVVLEPIAQVAISPNASSDPRIPVEDSLPLLFDETNLFEIDKFTGFDLYEGGARLNLGGRIRVDWVGGRNFSAMLGRSFHTDGDHLFPALSGLTSSASDWVAEVDATPLDGLRVYTRERLDGQSFEVHRAEVGADVAINRGKGYLRYVNDDFDPVQAGPLQDFEGGGEVYLTKHWGVSFDGVRDLDGGIWRRRDFGVLYKDECVRLDVVYEHRETYDRQLGPSNSVFVRLTLATLDDQGYRSGDGR